MIFQIFRTEEMEGSRRLEGGKEVGMGNNNNIYRALLNPRSIYILFFFIPVRYYHNSYFLGEKMKA